MRKIINDKYGRGSAAVNGEGFVDLEPGDTFSGLEAKLCARIAEVYVNEALGLTATIGSKRNANELSQHMAPGEDEEAHKFAAKNIGALFARGIIGIKHLDKKAKPGQRWVTTFIRVFAKFEFAGKSMISTITLKGTDDPRSIYSVEALEINQDACSERKPRGAISEDLNSAPLQNLASSLMNSIAYYVGDVNRTKPEFIGSEDVFTIEGAAIKIAESL